jgi:membrane protein required for colicin V production
LATLDWVVLAVLALSMLLGLWRGLVYEVLSVLNWIAAFLLARWLAPQAVQYMPFHPANERVQYAVGFVAVFLVALILGGLLAWAVKRLVAAAGLAPVDRVLGGVFGLVRGTVLVLAFAVVVHLVGMKDGAWWNESVTAGIATAALRGLKPAVPDRFGPYLPA